MGRRLSSRANGHQMGSSVVAIENRDGIRDGTLVSPAAVAMDAWLPIRAVSGVNGVLGDACQIPA